MVQNPSMPSSLTQAAYERLRADLLACRLRPGARLKINELCQTLSVSLSAVREALARLTSEGLVIAEPQRGFRATPISAADLSDVTQVRIQIECLCLERALALGDIAWESELVACFHRLSRTPERDLQDPERMSEPWSVAHAGFHRALVSACDSAWLLRLREILYAQSERYRRLSIPLAEVERDLSREHEALLKAALARDVQRSGMLLTQHIELTTQILLKQAWASPKTTVSDPPPRRSPDRKAA